MAIDGRYRLRLSNHAWETQYINALKLHAVDHAPGWEVLPTRKRELVRIGPTKALGRAISRDGREVSELLALRDEQQYRTASEVTRELTRSITYDWVDFEVQVPEGVREFFVALRVRNTLFSNVLLEDALLTGRGHQTIDLLGGERFRLLEMWRLRRWVNKQMGLRLLVDGRNGYRAVDRIGGTGPSAWRQVVVKVPARSAGPLGVRLSFLADSWLIDWVGVSFEGTDRVESQNLPLLALKSVDGGSISTQRLLEKDKHYFNLYPGETLEAIFSVGATPAHLQRTYFVETEGYLIKWLNPEQLAFSGRDFKPKNEDVFRAARRWLAQNTAMEQLFSAGLASRY